MACKGDYKICGIIGCAGLVTGKEERLFKEMLIVNSLRGLDSTGVASVGFNADTIVAKTVGDPFQLFETTKFQDALRRKNYALIGHNRAATTGRVIRKNAHPFDFDDLVGVHNGTLRNKHILEDSALFDTDSEALYWNIQKHGVDKALEKVDGAYALVWFDKVEGTINFLRNKERPLSLIFSEDRKTLFFASEVWMVNCILARDGYKYCPAEALPEDQHFSFEIPNDAKVFEKARVRHVKPTPFQNYVHKTTTASTTGTTTSGTNIYPNATEYLKKFGKKKSTFDLKVGLMVDGEAVSWSVASGNYYVNFTIDGYENEEFRCFVKGKKECEELLGNRYSGRINACNYLEGKWVYKLHPDTLIEEVDLNNVVLLPVLHKKDHDGQPISKDQFEKRYGNCGWCSSPVTFEEDWVAFTHSDCLCGACKDDKEVAGCIPQLRSMC